MGYSETLPVHDRRQHRRFLTRRNVGIATLACLLVFAAITIRSEMRRPSHGPYGSLFSRALPAEGIAAKPAPEVVVEKPIADQTGADPMLVLPAEREQYLGVDPTTTIVTPIEARATGVPDVRPGATGRVAIVGDEHGVAVVQEKRETPVLRGGFGRAD